MHEAGLEGRVTVLLEDYRKLRGRFTKLVSIEMIEAIGHENFPVFFERCRALLAEDGLMLLQAITIDDRLYDDARRSVDFIKRYIFPGCCIPALAPLRAAWEPTGLQPLWMEDIGEHYATTLAHWRQRLLDKRDAVLELGHDEGFVRAFEFYLAYCEGGFAERQLGDIQLLLAAPGYRRRLAAA